MRGFASFFPYGRPSEARAPDQHPHAPGTLYGAGGIFGF